MLDRFIIEFDKALRTLAGVHGGARPMPQPAPQAAPADGGPVPSGEAQDDRSRREAAALMRVNHCGEVCAQALYQGQALGARSPRVRAALDRAAREEADHLAWSEQRIRELGGRTSLLNPLWYAGSLVLGAVAGRMGDAWSLGFLVETERQVEAHLQSHLDRLDPSDTRTRAVVEAMQREEVAHANTARAMGGRELPEPVRRAMRASAKLMTTTTYRI